MNLKNLAGIAVLVTAFVGFVIWRSVEHVSNPEHLLLTVYDRSWSPADGCDSVVGITEQEMFTAFEKKQDFELVLVATGDAATANEPIKRFFTPVSFNSRVMDGKSQLENARVAFLQEVRRTCLAFSRTETSPILLGVKEGAAQLRIMGAQTGAEIKLVVISDLEENVDQELKQALHASHKSPYRASLPISNTGMPTLLCGYAQTTGNFVAADHRHRLLTPPRTVEQTERLRQVWRGVFADSSSVVLEPFCPAPRNPQG